MKPQQNNEHQSLSTMAPQGAAFLRVNVHPSLLGVTEMIKARQGKEVVVRTANKIGELAKLAKVVAERGVNIVAVSAWIEGAEAVIRLVTDDNLRTMDVLRDNGYKPQEQAVVLVDARQKPGIFRHLTDVLSKENIDMSHLFASAIINQDVCLLVLNSSDNDRAITVLNR